MSELAKLLTQSAREVSRTNNVAVLLSCGIDSVSVALTLQTLGKNVHAYTYEVQGYRSRERSKVEWLARHFGWKLTIITVPTSGLRYDFLELAVVDRCRTKVQFEVLWPLLYVLPQIREKEVWTGWNADDHYGNTKKVMLAQAGLLKDGLDEDERKERFDDWRRGLRDRFYRPCSPDSWWYALRLAERHGKRLIDPYLHEGIFDYFLGFDHGQLSPFKKPIVREAFSNRLRGVPDGMICSGIRLQKGGQVDVVFRSLLTDPMVNQFGSRSISALCQRWGRDVATNPNDFTANLLVQPPRPLAAVRIAEEDVAYKPYNLADVRRASDQKKFTFASMFAGGGGSSIGYRLAGGSGPLVNEFVPTAAATYERNFPETVVDRRDIRELLRAPTGIEDFLGRAGLKPGDLDILDGSPPCSEFSVAGNGIGDQDRLRPYSDVKQRSIATLPFDFVDVAVRARPKVAICENVPGLAYGHVKVLESIVHALRWPADHRAYYASWSILSANDFGVAQKRRRLFIIGVRRDVAEAVGIRSDDSISGLFPSATNSAVSIRAALSGLCQSESDISPWRQSAAMTSLGALIGRLPKHPHKAIRLRHVSLGETSNFTLTRCAWDLPAPTLVVTGQRPDGLSGAIHPEFDRKFTLPELKRLFGLPDDYVATGTLRQAAERICRMVPPFMTKAIAKSVYKKILLPYAEAMK